MQEIKKEKIMKNKKLLYGGLIVGAVALAYFLGRKKTPKVAEQNTPTPTTSDGNQSVNSCKNFIEIPCANPPCPKFCLDDFSIFRK
jgi:hypothetical protein